MNKTNTWLLWGNLFALAAGAYMLPWSNYAMAENGNLFSIAKAAGPPPAVISSFNDDLQPTRLTWEVLSDVTYRKKWDKEMQMEVMYPVFGDKVKKLQGKDLYISGFIIPLDLLHGTYAISANPFSSCFFCGGSGPESVISLKFKNGPLPYDIDEYLTMRGALALNDTSANDFIYQFKNAEEYNN